jgi:DNA primase
VAKTLLDVLEEFNISTKDSGGGRKVANCPLPNHEGDNTPSFTIYPDGGYFCFGCGGWGDALKFLIDYKGMTNVEGLEYLGEDYKQTRAEKSLVIKVKNTTLTWKFLWNIAESYHQFLLGMPGALSYLHKRGLIDETIRKFKLGYTDGYVLKLAFASDYALGKEVGIITDKGYEKLSHRITIPNLLDKGECDFIVGRTVTGDNVKYLGARMPKPIYGFYEVRNSPIIFITEGQFDFLLLRQWGLPAVALGGSSLSRADASVFDDKKLIIVPDNDDPGRKAANTIHERFKDNSLIFDYSFMGVKDVGEVAALEKGKEVFMGLVDAQIGWIHSLPDFQKEKWFKSILGTE